MILVIGAGGTIGSALIEQLRALPATRNAAQRLPPREARTSR